MAKTTSMNAIDVGSSKISCLITVGSNDPDKINVVGVATTPSRGVRKGQIVDIDEAVSAITDCVEAAERMAGFSINNAYVSVSGEHIQSQNSKGVVAITQPEGEIGEEDVYRKIAQDLEGAGLTVSEGEIRRKMDELSSVAREQIRAGE